MYTEADALPGMKVVKTTFDDRQLLARLKPTLEIYTSNRVPWCGAVEGAVQEEHGI